MEKGSGNYFHCLGGIGFWSKSDWLLWKKQRNHGSGSWKQPANRDRWLKMTWSSHLTRTQATHLILSITKCRSGSVGLYWNGIRFLSFSFLPWQFCRRNKDKSFSYQFLLLLLLLQLLPACHVRMKGRAEPPYAPSVWFRNQNFVYIIWFRMESLEFIDLFSRSSMIRNQSTGYNRETLTLCCFYLLSFLCIHYVRLEEVKKKSFVSKCQIIKIRGVLVYFVFSQVFYLLFVLFLLS